MKTTVLFFTMCLAFGSVYGQSPTPTPTCAACTYDNDPCPGPSAAPDKKAEQFGTANGGESGAPIPLFWDIYLPSPTPPPNTFWPVVILVEDGGFQNGRRCDHQLKCIARDLTASNFAVVAIDIRHDTVGDDDALPCQKTQAFAPQFSRNQISDLKQAINKARTPSSTDFLYGKVNHKVGAIGGSGGGAHVAWCAATGTPGNPNNEKLDAAVCLSGAYAFYDDASLKTYNQCSSCNNDPCDTSHPKIFGFCENVTDYCQVMRNDDSCVVCTNQSLVTNQDLIAASPLGKIDDSGTDTAPLYAFATFQDFMPGPQFELIKDELDGFSDGDRYRHNEFQAKDPGTGKKNKHSFAYWFDATDDEPTTYVNELAKDFLAEFLMP